MTLSSSNIVQRPLPRRRPKSDPPVPLRWTKTWTRFCRRTPQMAQQQPASWKAVAVCPRLKCAAQRGANARNGVYCTSLEHSST